MINRYKSSYHPQNGQIGLFENKEFDNEQSLHARQTYTMKIIEKKKPKSTTGPLLRFQNDRVSI
jgi:hypothetical protein